MKVEIFVSFFSAISQHVIHFQLHRKHSVVIYGNIKLLIVVNKYINSLQQTVVSTKQLALKAMDME